MAERGLKLVPGRYAMTVYPCGCSVCRTNERAGSAVMSVGVCELHQRRPAVELALIAQVVDELGRQSGLPMIVDTVKMGEDFADYIRERGFGDGDEESGVVDGTA